MICRWNVSFSFFIYEKLNGKAWMDRFSGNEMYVDDDYGFF